MINALKNQNGASFLLLVLVMSSIMMVTLLSIGYNMYQWNQTTAQFQRRLNSMIALESLATEVKEAYATAQEVGGGACPATRDLAPPDPAAPAPPMNDLPTAGTGIGFDMDNDGQINGTEAAIANRFCFPDRLCIPHPNPGVAVGANTDSLICFDPGNPGGGNIFDPGNYQKRLNLKATYVMNFKPLPPKKIWERIKYEAVAQLDNLFINTERAINKVRNTAVAQILVPRPNIASGDFDSLQRVYPGNAMAQDPITNPLTYNCPATNVDAAAIGGGFLADENVVCKSCANSENLACITLQVCLHPNCGSLATTSAADTRGWYKQVIGIKLNR